jgi:predicted MPP superfamily phosphohydrolase
MSPIVWKLFVALAAAGHFAFAVWLFNRLHARAWPYRQRQLLERVLVAVTLGIPLLVLSHVGHVLFGSTATLGYWGLKSNAWITAGWAYGFFCCGVLVLSVPVWLWPKLRYRVPAALIENDTQVVDLTSLAKPTVAGVFPRFCASLPGNEVFRLHVQVKKLRHPRLPVGLQGLRIAHLTDLHLTGKVGMEYFREVVQLTNELKPDLVVMTGDIAEKTSCLAWVRPLFEKLQAPCGRFYVLGNHDFLLPDVAALRAELQGAGLVDLHGTSVQVPFRDTQFVLAGNELPWCGPAPEVTAPLELFRILLAHTPDLIPWARQQGFDLMLAGHNHGGQICFPLIGPLISPSKYGVRYAAGLFHEGPTLLHVGRGISGEHLLRWNCPPELTLIVLD